MGKIQDKQLKEVCKMGQGEKTCRYIVCGADGFTCGKNGPLYYDLTFNNQMRAKGDNCNGM